MICPAYRRVSWPTRSEEAQEHEEEKNIEFSSARRLRAFGHYGILKNFSFLQHLTLLLFVSFDWHQYGSLTVI